MDGNATAEEQEAIKKLSNRVLIDAPTPQEPEPTNSENIVTQVIKKVPKTGINAFISSILGIQLLGLGGYFIYNKTKKETL